MVLDRSYRILWTRINRPRKRELFKLVFLIIFSSFSEVVSLGAVVPFLIILTNPDKVYYNSFLHDFILKFGYSEPSGLILPITIFFIFTSLLAGLIRIYLLKTSTNLSYQIGADISREIYKNALYLDYIDHIQRNSSILISGIISKANQVVTYTIQPLLNLLSSITILVVIFIVMLSVDPILIISTFAALICLYLVFAVRAKKKLLENSKVLSSELTNLQRILSEGFGGIRDVILDNTQEIYLRKYIQSDQPYRMALSDNAFKTSAPKYYVESFGLVAFALFAYYITSHTGSLVDSLPILGALALAAQRMLPIIQIAFNSWANLRAGRSILADVISLLELRVEENISSFDGQLKIDFHKGIHIRNLGFRYPGSEKDILSKLNFEIKKGERIGIVGKTGSGKSTLLDLLMGLLYPTEGCISIDEQVLTKDSMRYWQKSISHVPQTIFLSDATIANNIALGVPKEEIDIARVWNCLENAELAGFVKSLPEQLETSVGERGVKLSGGQRQRIGIARALYKEAKIIVFDEATSALDEGTEDQLMKSIYNLRSDITIIIVAHRLSTIKRCDTIIKLNEGMIEKIGTYESVIGGERLTAQKK